MYKKPVRGSDRNREREWFSRRPNYEAPFDQRQGLVLKRSASQYYKDHAGETSFFFTNFPENFGREELWSVFQRYGKVIEVFIPARKDKLGNRFGFVRFLEVSNVKDLEARLNWILI